MTKILQIKISLDNSKPLIWRRFQVKDSISFHQLHEIIQVVMGWDASHLYEFFIDKRIQIGEPHEDYNEPPLDAKKIKLNEIIRNPKQKIEYVYDFGDGWDHTLKLEKIMEEKKDQKYPVCLDGERNCPPDDCGGIGGYKDLLKILKNKKHEEHKEMLEWLGNPFDSEAFDCEKVNKELKRFAKKTSR